jgi:hypothetical protein
LFCLSWFSGCGGYYILTVPDHVAPNGGEAAAIVRLQRNDAFILSPAVRGAAMRFYVPGSAERAAYTDKLGYAGTTVAVPKKPGRYTFRTEHLDYEGEEIAGEGPLYVWDPQRRAVAVDLDALPMSAGGGDSASAALRRVGEEANVVYLTRRSTRHHGGLHDQLNAVGYPDGPILMWQRQRWHIVKGRFNIPRIVVESRLVSQLPHLRETFPGLTVGICDSGLAARAFAGAELRCIVIGDAGVDAPDMTRLAHWSELTAEAL